MPSWIKRVLISTYLVFIHLVLIYFLGRDLLNRFTHLEPLPEQSVTINETSTPVPSPIPVPETFADQIPENTNTSDADPTAASSTGSFQIPVAGVKPEQLLDSYTHARSEGRMHDAIDIPAPLGTPVIAATDGEIVKFFDSERGGITVYEKTTDGKFVLYYAHLSRRAEEILVGTKVAKGTTIGYVGDTGNAGAGNYHLHFSISRVVDPNRIWEGESINPYPVLRYGQLPQ